VEVIPIKFITVQGRRGGYSRGERADDIIPWIIANVSNSYIPKVGWNEQVG